MAEIWCDNDNGTFLVLNAKKSNVSGEELMIRFCELI